MSVIHFDVSELGNLAACCVESRKDTKRIFTVCAALGELSMSNTIAHRNTYSDSSVGASPIQEIILEAWEVIGAGCVNKERGARDLRSMGYNCDDLEGTPEALDVVRDSFLGCYGTAGIEVA